MKKQWMLGLFGGVLASVAAPAFGGDVTTPIDGIELGGQVRARYEYRAPETYVINNRFRDESDDRGMLRTSLHARLDVGDGITGLIEMRDAHVNGATAVGTDDAGVTLHQGYLNIEDIFGISADLLIGRVELNYGSERIIGSSDWSNASRHWDGARLRFKPMDGTWIDVGYAELVNGDTNIAANGTPNNPAGHLNNAAAGATVANNPDQDYDLYWGWVQHNLNDDIEINGYLLWEHDGLPYRQSEKQLHNPGLAAIAGVGAAEGMDRYTWGALVKADMGPLNAEVEYALQRGEFGPDNISADLFVGILGFDLNDSTGFQYEYVRASGDRDDFDGTREGFVAPFPTGHRHLGIADQVGFRNIEAHRLGADYDLDEKTSFSADWWWFHRQDGNDSWYNAAGTAVRTGQGGYGAGFADNFAAAPGGRAGHSNATEIGQEFDLVMTHKYSKYLTFSAGWAHFFNGRFVQETRTDTEDMDFAYIMADLKF